jgi:hypothetical protein
MPATSSEGITSSARAKPFGYCPVGILRLSQQHPTTALWRLRYKFIAARNSWNKVHLNAKCICGYLANGSKLWPNICL